MANAPCILGDDSYLYKCYNKGVVKITEKDDPIAIKLKKRIQIYIDLSYQYSIEKDKMKGLSYYTYYDGTKSVYLSHDFWWNCIYNLNQIRQKNWYWKKLVD